jgi:hypothetical protein
MLAVTAQAASRPSSRAPDAFSRRADVDRTDTAAKGNARTNTQTNTPAKQTKSGRKRLKPRRVAGGPHP